MSASPSGAARLSGRDRELTKEIRCCFARSRTTRPRVRATCSAARPTTRWRSSTRTSTSSTSYLEAADRARLADRGGVRDPRPGRPRVRPAGARRAHRRDRLPARRRRRRVRACAARRRQRIELGNTVVTAISTPGHAPAHHAYAVADRRRGTDEPWLVFTGDSLLIGDVGRPDLHVAGDARGQARLLHASLARLLELPDHVVRAAEPLRRLRLRPRPLRQPVQLDRLRARPQRHARVTAIRTRSRPHCSRTPRRARPSRSGSSPPTAAARRSPPHDARSGSGCARTPRSSRCSSA